MSNEELILDIVHIVFPLKILNENEKLLAFEQIKNSIKKYLEK